MSNYVLDRAFLIEESGGVASHRAVVAGTNVGGCRYPSGANTPGTIGVTTHAQELVGRAVGVRLLGIAPCEAVGAIAHGARVGIGDAEGRVGAIVLPSAQFGEAGANDSVRYDLLAPEAGILVSSLVHSESGPDAALGVALAGGTLTVTLATNGSGSSVTTAAELATFINSNPLTRPLLRASAGGDGTGILGDDSVGIDGWDNALHPVGIALQDATAAGDIIDVLLTP